MILDDTVQYWLMGANFGLINARESWMDNQSLTMQIHWQHLGTQVTGRAQTNQRTQHRKYKRWPHWTQRGDQNPSIAEG